ncbi:alpha/beta fold hydrolase [Actinosynnema sp. NPDC020468]|uniref:alpha/beta fold hydrolase n=1 Tax=Actinosynnema sp. NPDC020468 TaxID=3154488 RepID=UPI0033CE7E5C
MVGRFANDKARQRFSEVYEAQRARWPGPAEELDVPTAFGTTRVRRSGTGPALVLLHGVFGNSLTWRHHAETLGAHHTLYAVDTIGEPGLSAQTADLTGAEDCASWLSSVLTGLSLARPHLAGISRGAWLALNLAAREPSAVGGVHAVEPAGFGRVGARFHLSSLVTFAGLAFPSLVPRRARVDETARQAVKPLLGVAFGYRVQVPPILPLSDDELRAVTAPVRVLLGERSEIHRTAEVTARLTTVRPDWDVRVVPGGTHALSLRRPDLVDGFLLDA